MVHFEKQILAAYTSATTPKYVLHLSENMYGISMPCYVLPHRFKHSLQTLF
jgi:hypothetical protein